MVRIFLATATLVLALGSLAAGCAKSPCEKAAERLIDCMDELCAVGRDQTRPPCDDQAATALRIRQNTPQDCSGVVAEQSTMVLDLTCEDIRGGQFRN